MALITSGCGAKRSPPHQNGPYHLGSRCRLSATLWALVLGLLIVNGLKRPFPAVVEFLKPAAKQGEFFIKIGLVTAATPFGASP